MREPGEDDESGENHQMLVGGGVAQPTLGADLCGCPKPPGCWGAHGWHFAPDPQHPGSLAAAHVYERCPAYAAAVERGGGYEKTKRRRKRAS